MDIAVQTAGHERAVLALTGRLDLVSAATFRGAVARTVAGGHPRIVVDLAHVPFIDSSGLGALVGALKHAQDGGGQLRIASPLPEVLDVLTLMRLDHVLPPYASVADALSDDG